MHAKRQTISKRIPIKRKGTKFVATARSHKQDSVPLVIAIRDMLGLARDLKEVKKMINSNSLKVNWRPVDDPKYGIKLFGILHADKDYVLKISPNNKFIFEETKDTSKRIVKIIRKTTNKKNKIQLTFHDGTTLLSDNSYNVGDTIMLSKDNKISSHKKFEKGNDVFVISGSYAGLTGKVVSREGRTAKVIIDKGEKELPVKILVLI